MSQEYLLRGASLARLPLHMLETTAQKAAFCCYLIDSTAGIARFANVDIDTELFKLFIESTAKLPSSARLALALSLTGDLLVAFEQQKLNVRTAQHRLTPTIKHNNHESPSS